MLEFPLWKKLLIWAVCALGLWLAMPNLFYAKVETHNDAIAEGVEDTSWPSFLPNSLINLGLDLRGGAHLLVEVEVEQVYEDRMDGMWPEFRDALRGVKDQVGTVRRISVEGDTLNIRIGEPIGLEAGLEAARALTSPIVSLTGAGSQDFEVSGSGDTISVQMSDAERQATDDRTMEQSLEIIRRRVDEAGTREPTIQRQGQDRILIQVPGIGSAEELLELIGKTAKLTFHPVENRTSDADARAGAGNILIPSLDEPDTYYILERRPVITGEHLVDAQPSFDQNNRPAVSFRLNPTGGRLFGEYTAANIGNPFAIVLDEEVISAPTIQSHIPGGSGIITGRFSVEESTRLAILLRAGALPAEINVLEQRTVGPELGQDSIDAGRIAAIVAFTAVLIFMILTYGMFGLFADIALILNVALIFGLLSLIGATLTLPGIAGIVLTIGMAVDANVLIFERIREELKTAKGPARAIQLGYEKALSAIMITLGLGIMTSVFTAIYVTRLIIVTWYDAKRPKTIEV